MVMLTTLLVFILSGLATACVAPKDAEEIKAQIQHLKKEKADLYAKFASEWQPCQPPGIEQSIECHYRLTINKLDKNSGVATASIPKDVIKDHEQYCKDMKKSGDLPNTYDCPNPAGHHKDIVFTFELENPQNFT